MTSAKHPLDDIDWEKLAVTERQIVRQETKRLNGEEGSELETGERIVRVRTILEPYGEFGRWLRGLPSTERTYYRRIKSFERAHQMWPLAVLQAAIARRLQIIGWSEKKPMGLFEDAMQEIELPSRFTQHAIEEYLSALEMYVRRATSQPGDDPVDVQKQCFRFLENRIVGLPKEMAGDLIGMLMTLTGVYVTSARDIPEDFWMKTLRGPARSAESRANYSKSASDRWARLKKAKASA